MLSNYLKIALKVLLRRKVFTAISLFGISITLAVLLVVAALLDQVFGPQPPEVHAERTLGVFFVELRGPNSSRNGFPGYGLLDGYVRTLSEPEAVSVFSAPERVQSFQRAERTDLFLKRTDGAYWRILDFEFLEGGPFTAEDDRQGNPVAVINASTRRTFFGDGPAVGEVLEVDGQRFRVVGVVRDVPIYRLVPFADVWVPTGTSKSDAYRTQIHGGFMAVLLARRPEDVPAIKAELRARLPDVTLPGDFDVVDTRAETMMEFVARVLFGTRSEGQPGRFVLVVGLLMLLFMILPAVNLVNLNVSRIMERASEIGMRKAFGASSWTMVGQFVVENLVVTLLGGLVGLLLAYGALGLIAASDLIPYVRIGLNYRLFGYALLLVLVFGLLSGVYPAWRMSRLHPAQALTQRAS